MCVRERSLDYLEMEGLGIPETLSTRQHVNVFTHVRAGDTTHRLACASRQKGGRGQRGYNVRGVASWVKWLRQGCIDLEGKVEG